MPRINMSSIGYSFYQIDDIGNVFSELKRAFQTHIHKPNEAPVQLSPFVRGDGYLAVDLLSDNGRTKKTESIHRLVALMFIPNAEGFPIVNHKDGVKTNNSANNLEWCSHQFNTRHALENGLLNIRHLTRLQVEDICLNLQRGLTIEETANITTVPIYTIAAIRARINYSEWSSGYVFPDRTGPLSEATVLKIAEFLAASVGAKEIANKFNLPEYVITDIKRKACYRSLTDSFEFPSILSDRMNGNDISFIAEMMMSGKSNKQISEVTGTSVQVIKNIRAKRSYSNLTLDYIFPRSPKS